MCGRLVTVIPHEELKQIFDLIVNKVKPEPRYNLCPSQLAPVVRSTDNGNDLDLLKWGLVPSWSKDIKSASHMINARSETVAEKSSFRHAIKKNRCIIPVTGFYEWSRLSGEKHPHFIHMADSSPMPLAGIWEHWKSPDGKVVESFSILTTAANKLISTLHDRMPVILQPNMFSIWLDRGMNDAHALDPLYVPYHDEELSYYRVPDLVNNPRLDSPACIARV